MKRWLAGGVLGWLSVGALMLLYAAKIERERVQLDRHAVRLEQTLLPRDGVTILHLSDFHFRASGRVQDRKVQRVRGLLARERYDVVALTGDLIHDVEGLPAALALIKTLRPRYGAFFVPGNHDYAEYTPWGVFGHTWRERTGGRDRASDLKHAAGALVDFIRKVARNELVRMPVRFNDVPAMLEALAAAGVTPLVNNSRRLRIDGVDICFAGVDDATESRVDLAAAFEDVRAGEPLVLLAHNPDIWLDHGVDRADLVLSGHTHGGQIRLPLIGAVHTQGTHLLRRQPAGWFARGLSRMYVSRGLGESIPLRLGARPQVTLIHLTGPQQRP